MGLYCDSTELEDEADAALEIGVGDMSNAVAAVELNTDIRSRVRWVLEVLKKPAVVPPLILLVLYVLVVSRGNASLARYLVSNTNFAEVVVPSWLFALVPTVLVISAQFSGVLLASQSWCSQRLRPLIAVTVPPCLAGVVLLVSDYSVTEDRLIFAYLAGSGAILTMIGDRTLAEFAPPGIEFKRGGLRVVRLSFVFAVVLGVGSVLAVQLFTPPFPLEQIITPDETRAVNGYVLTETPDELIVLISGTSERESFPRDSTRLETSPGSRWHLSDLVPYASLSYDGNLAEYRPPRASLESLDDVLASVHESAFKEPAEVPE